MVVLKNACANEWTKVALFLFSQKEFSVHVSCGSVCGSPSPLKRWCHLMVALAWCLGAI